ncbi:50S ribosomal protein L29 [Candidatus Falkowbacteria bacterium]|jgi:ribosomal protein L29|nr:50S ribosomal protein L29 [Candidatus Falkowbacteria bacterium]
MRSNDIKALHDKTIEELKVQLDELLMLLAKSRLEKKAGKLKNTHIAMLADDVARVKTVIRNKELVGAKK